MTETFERAFAAMPLVAILRGITPEEAVDVADALMSAGFRLIEVPLNSPRPFESIELLAAHCGSEAAVGAGTVLRPAEVARLAATGADLMVTPNTDPSVIDAARGAALSPVIGCLTPSEALQAVAAGVTALKVFPAARLGPGYLKDLRAILPNEIRLIPVGGVSLDNLSDYHAQGADGFGFGTGLYLPGRSATDVGKAATSLVEAYRRLTGR